MTLTFQNLNELLIIDINVHHICCGIWENLDSENQHQSNGRLFQYSYMYGLHWTLCSSETTYCCLIFVDSYPLDIVCKMILSQFVFTDTFLHCYGIGSWMLCLCPNWLWKNPCICVSHAHEAQGIVYILSSCLFYSQYPLSRAPKINCVYRFMQKVAFELLSFVIAVNYLLKHIESAKSLPRGRSFISS